MKIVRALTRAGNDEHLDLGTVERVMISTACKVHPRMLNLYLKADQDRDITKFLDHTPSGSARHHHSKVKRPRTIC